MICSVRPEPRPGRQCCHPLSLGLVLVICATAWPAAGEDLAAQAAYGVTVSGYVYRGQVIPGSNTPATEQGFMPAPPWVGPADALTDGKRDGAAVTSWFWSQMNKRITARFDLRRNAAIASVRAWPATGRGSFDAGTFRVAPTVDALAQAPECALRPANGGWVWEGAAQAGRFVEVVCASGAPQMTLAEVEIEGEPRGEVLAGAPAPGLTPGTPRDLAALVKLPAKGKGVVNLARRPRVEVTLTSRHHDDRTGAWADDRCAVDSDPTGRALLDGNRDRAVRSFTGWYAAKRLLVEVDLGAAADVDRVVVWSSGHGPSRSFINRVDVWLQAGDGAAWMPVAEHWNPLLPAEVPAAEYPIVTPVIGRPATRVRLELVGVAQSADLMQVGEIEVWGKAADQPLAARPWRVKRPVPQVEPVATSRLDSAYGWLQHERLRGMYGYVGQWQDEDLLGRISAAGFNCMLVHTMGKTHRQDGWPAEAAEWVKVQRERELRVIVSWPFGSDERYGNTQFGAYQPGGAVTWTRGPCPLSAEYWDRVVSDRAVTAAEAGLTGLVVDMEMYGADATRYPGPCYCDACWSGFVDEHLEGVAADEVPLPGRPAWIAANDLAGDYARRQELGVMAILQAIRRRVRAANPLFLLGNLLDPESVPGLARGFGTPTMPALVFSELEYHGGIAGTPGRLQQLRARGYPVWYVPGLYIKPVTPPRLPELVRTIGPASGGYWIWSTAAFASNPRGEYAHAEDYSHDDYWGAFRRANEALTAALRAGGEPARPAATGPRAVVPRISGTGPTAADWEQAVVLGPFVGYSSGESAHAATEVKALWGSSLLHLWATCKEPHPENMRVAPAERDDGSLWKQDSLEVFWRRPGSAAYVHVVVNAAGVFCDSRSDGIRPEDPGWNADITATASRGKSEWGLQLTLPLSGDGGRAMVPGDELRVELGRNRPGGGETTCWAPTGGMYRGAPNLWGTLVLQ